MTESGLAIVPKPVAYELVCPECCEPITNPQYGHHLTCWYVVPTTVTCKTCDQTYPVARPQE